VEAIEDTGEDHNMKEEEASRTSDNAAALRAMHLMSNDTSCRNTL